MDPGVACPVVAEAALVGRPPFLRSAYQAVRAAWVRLYLGEQVIVLAALWVLLFYQLQSIRLRDPVKLFVTRVEPGLLCYGVGCLLTLLFMRLRDIHISRSSQLRCPLKNTAQRFAEVFTPRRVLEDVRLVCSISLLFVVFVQMKHSVPLVASTFFDGQIAAVEKAILGASIVTLTQSAFAWMPAAFWSDVYTSWYPFMALAIVFFLCQPNRSILFRFFNSFVMLWILGILCVYFVPSLGPCFSSPDLVAQLPATEVSEMQMKLWRWKLHLEAFPRSDRGIYLISGLPSLHVAVVLLVLWYVSQVHRLLGWATALFLVFTIVSTFYFGWHFASDHLAAGLLALVCIKMSEYAYARLDTSSTS